MSFLLSCILKYPVPYNFNEIAGIKTVGDFEEMAMKAFIYQYFNNSVYRSFCDHLGIGPGKISGIFQIPFLPIQLFKGHKIVSGEGEVEKIFRSSGTTAGGQSSHFLLHESMYQQSLLEGFRRVFGDPSGYSFLGLLPGYLERPDSSLIYMVNELMKQSSQQNNVFFKEPDDGLLKTISYNQLNNIPTILFGVAFSLLRFADQNPVSLKGVILIETGGMKGQEEEITRTELHERLMNGFGLEKIFSEYGMTELLSQAYSVREEEFILPPWMHVMMREINDPFNYVDDQRAGGINVIDLANIYSCCFISTQDLGKKTSPNTFEVLGRFDNSDIRGCNLLYS